MWLYGNSTAGSATITNNFGLTFFNSSTAGNANITNNSYLYFQNSSTAGSANVTNTGTLRFYNNSTGGSAAIITGAGATTDFSTSTGPNGDGKLSAGSIAGGGSYMLGSNQLTVGSNGLSTEVTGVISGTGSLVKTGSGTLTLSGINVYSGGTTINGGTLQIGTAANTGAVSGAVTVNAGSTLNVTNAITSWITGITNIGTTNFQTGTSASSIAFGNSGYLNFYGTSGAGSAVITNSGYLYFYGTSAAGSATITNNNGLAFVDASTASGANITNNFGLVFKNASTAGSATITNNGYVQFFGTSTAGSAAINNSNVNATVDFSNSIGPNGDGKLSAGSIAGGGSYALGANQLTVGSNNSTTEVSGIISGSGGSLVKVGTGTLTLSGANTYSGGTTINGGTLQLGTAVSAGAIQGAATVNAGGTFNVVNADTSGIATITNSGITFFRNGTSAGSATVTNNHYLYFLNSSTAGSANITNNFGLFFNDSSTAGGSAITNNGGLNFNNTSTAGNATITNNGGLNFNNSSTAGNATITNNGNLNFNNTSTAGNAAVANSAVAVTDFSSSFGPNGHGKLSAGSIAGGGTFNLGANELTVGSNNLSTVVSGVISGSGGSLVKIGTGTLTLSGANTYTGGTTISSGTLQVGNGGASGSIVGDVLNNGVLAFNRSNTATFSGAISGSGAVQQIGSGTTILTGANGYTGNTLVSGGRLQFGDGSAGGSNTLGGNLTVTGGTLAIQTPATVNIARAVTFADNTALSIVAGTNSPALSAGSVSIGSGVTFNIGGIDSASQLDKVLIDTRSGISGDFANVTVGGFSGTVDYLTVSTHKSANNLQYLASYGLSWFAGNNLARGTFTLTNATDTFTVGTALTDQAANPATGWNGSSLTKAGAGTLILTGTNTYTGGTTISGGTLQLGNGGNTGSILGDVANNGTLVFNRGNTMIFSGDISGSGAVRQIGAGTTILTGTNSYSGGTTISAGVLQIGNGGTSGLIAGNVVNNATLAFSRSDAVTFSGAISGSGSVMKLGTDTLTLSGNNSYTGSTTVAGGTLSISSDGNLGTGGTLALLNGTTLAFTQGGVYTHAITVGGDPTFDVAAGQTVTQSGVISNGSSPGDVVKTGAGTLTLIANNTYTGGTTISAGTLQLGNGGNTGSLLGDVVNNGTLAFNRSDMATYSGNISGTGTVQQIGMGTTILTGTNSYTGDTLVSSGTLQFGNGSAGGSNNLGGNLTVTGGTLAIQTPATANVARAVTFADNTTLSIVAGTKSPALSAGSVSIGSGVTFNIGGIDSASQLDKVLIDTRSGISGDFANVTVGGFSGTVDYLTVSTHKSADNLQYLASYGLSWFAGNNLARGTFTLTNATDTFTVGTALTDQAANPATGWNGSSLIKAGVGTLTLTADNTYTGGTTIAGGVLSVSRDANLGAAPGGLTFTGGTLATTASFDTARLIALTQAGNFDVANGTELGLTGVVSGGGNLVKQGGGTLRLDNGANAYGNTLVAAGTLIGHAGSISGNIGNAGTVIFNQATDASFAGDVGALNGTRGTMVKRGAGTLTLTGMSSLDWTISAGSLVSSAGRFGGNAAIASGASFTFNQTANAAYAGVLSGNGGFNKTGTGLLNLTGDSSAFSGTTLVQVGTLAVNGLLGGMLDVLAGGRLQGIGTVGSTTVNGTVAPGNSIGTLTIAGSITFNPGSIYEVEINAQGQSDKIVASGTATINGGTVQVLAGAGNYAPQTRYNILTATGGLTANSTFSGVTTNLAFLTPSLSYDASNVWLTMTRNNIDFKAIGVTPNQIAAGGGVESLGFGNSIYNAVSNLSAPQARSAFGQLSGEINASAKTTMIDDSRFVRGAVNDRIRAAFDRVGAANGAVTTYIDGKPVTVAATTDHLAVWGQGFGSWGNTNGDGNATRLNRSIDGFFIGADAPAFDNWRFGAVAGYSATHFDVKDYRSSGWSDNYHVGLYGGTTWGALAFRTGTAFTVHDITATRSVILPGLSDTLTGHYNAGTAQVFGELGYGINAGAARFEPFANLAYVSLHTDAFTEKGGAAALTSAATATDTTFSTLGLRTSTTFDIGGTVLTARSVVGWRHAFGDATPFSTMRFASGGDFTIGGVPIARNASVVEAGIDYALSPKATLSVTYGGQFGSGVSDQSGRSNFNVKF